MTRRPRCWCLFLLSLGQAAGVTASAYGQPAGGADDARAWQIESPTGFGGGLSGAGVAGGLEGNLAPAGAPVRSPSSPIDWQILEKPNGPHVAVIFDPVRRVLAVYHIDPADGAIKLKSVRSLGVDLRLRQFNSGDPTPAELESALRPGS